MTNDASLLRAPEAGDGVVRLVDINSYRDDRSAAFCSLHSANQLELT
jgi:hypothetical protein